MNEYDQYSLNSEEEKKCESDSLILIRQADLK